MKRQSTALLAAAVLGLGAFGCFKDPVSDLQGSPSRVSLSRRFLQPTVNETTVVNVQVLDAQGNPLVLENVTYSTLDPAVANIEPLPDSVLRNFPGLTLTKANVIAGAPGTTKLVIAANGVSDTITVITYPGSFTGTITPAAAKPGDTITITAPALTTFSTTATAAGVGGTLYKFVSRSATTLRYIAGGEMTALDISGGILLGSIPLPTLRTSATFAVVQPSEAQNDVPTTGPAVAIPAAVGDSTVVYGAIDGSDTDDFYSVTGVVGDIFQVRVDWPVCGTTDCDIDVLLMNTAGTGYLNVSGGTSANPETFTRTITATSTTSRIQVNMYDAHGHTESTPYRMVVYRR